MTGSLHALPRCAIWREQCRAPGRSCRARCRRAHSLPELVEQARLTHAMMPQPATRSNGQVCEALRFSATPRGAVLPISQGGPVIPSIAAMPIDLGTDAMCHLRTHALQQKESSFPRLIGAEQERLGGSSGKRRRRAFHFRFAHGFAGQI
jgi:hypothetical protein